MSSLEKRLALSLRLHWKEERKEVHSVFLATKGNNRSYIRDLSKVQCHECKKFGHVASQCKKENFCVYCKKIGHIISECIKPPKSQAKPNFKAYQAVSEEPKSKAKPDESQSNKRTNAATKPDSRHNEATCSEYCIFQPSSQHSLLLDYLVIILIPVLL